MADQVVYRFEWDEDGRMITRKITAKQFIEEFNAERAREKAMQEVANKPEPLTINVGNARTVRNRKAKG
ncbi:MAG: hypothetical protein AB7E49_10670 [Campylobacterales bacterium]